MSTRLLVVDSDRKFIQDHKAQLESAFEADFLFSTDGALTRLESGQYGAILLCVETSENKGYALCSAIRRTPLLQDLKIALISAKASEEEYARHRGTKGRADLYLHKPVNSSSLIPALADLVPMKEDDPDNPLGDLAGSDLGEEWLESLKSELETEAPAAPAPAPPPAAIAPAPGWTAAPMPERAPGRNDGEVELLEWRVRDLEQKLVVHHEEIERKNREIEDLLQRNAAVTRNLDEVQQVHHEAERLRQVISDKEASLARSKEELEAALAEARRTADRLEERDVLLAEAQRKNEELLETHQLLQAQLEEAWETGGKVKALEASLEEAGQALRQAEERVGQAERGRDDAAGERDQARLELEASRSELEARDARVRELEGSLAKVGELEAELASTREQVSFQELTIRNLAEERRDLQAARDRQDDAITEQAGEIIVLQERIRLQETASRDTAEERDALLEVRTRLQEKVQALEGTIAELEGRAQRLEAESTARCEALEAGFNAQRAEFAAGIQAREESIAGLNEALEGLRRDLGRFGQEKRDAEALAQRRADRIEAITAVLAELEGKAGQALDLARTAAD
jgi:CheY-like chemotaxis protein